MDPGVEQESWDALGMVVRYSGRGVGAMERSLYDMAGGHEDISASGESGAM